MSTITAVLASHADGTLHLPLPEELRGKKVCVTATIEELAEPASDPKCGTKNALETFDETKKLRDDSARGTKTVLEALEELRKRGGLGHVIPDPVAWQREQRKDRTLWPEL